MTDERSQGDGPPDAAPDEDGAPRVDVPAGTGPEPDRLPPPVFPPGSRRDVPIRRSGPSSSRGGEEGDFPDDAFISPDDPIRARDEEAVPDDAFISPDDPIVRSRDPGEPDDDEVQVTGIGGQKYARGEARRSGRGRTWEEVDTSQVARMLEELARGLKEKGSTALLVTSEMTRFESMLRGFLAGYLVSRDD